MRTLSVSAAVVAACLIAAPAMAEPAQQPPMNDFLQAFYNCEGGAFLVSYDSETPQRATLTTNLKNKTYEMKRATAPTGSKFAGEAAWFWTDGKTVTIEGTATPLKNCKIKAH